MSLGHQVVTVGILAFVANKLREQGIMSEKQYVDAGNSVDFADQDETYNAKHDMDIRLEWELGPRDTRLVLFIPYNDATWVGWQVPIYGTSGTDPLTSFTVDFIREITKT